MIGNRILVGSILALCFLLAVAASDKGCWKTTYTRPAYVPQGCPSGTENSVGLCYTPCRSGYYGLMDWCYQNCPSGWRDDGTACWIDAATTWQCGGDCPSGFYRSTVCTCQRNVQRIGKSNYHRGVGTTPNGCDSGQSNEVGLCYPNCRANFNGVGVVCWAKCPSMFPYECGAFCTRNAYECASSTIEMVSSSLQFFVNIAMFVATAGGSTGIKAIADLGAKDAIRSIIKSAGKEMPQYILEKEVDMLASIGINGGGVDWSVFASLDPTGIANVVLAFNHPICELCTPGYTIVGSMLREGQSLYAGQVLMDDDGHWLLALQFDGNLVQYTGCQFTSDKAIWATNTASTTAPSGLQLTVQTDGNLVLYGNGRALWATGTMGGFSPRVLVLQADRNLVLYSGYAYTGQRAMWANNKVIQV